MTFRHAFVLFLSTCGSVLLAALTAFVMRLVGNLATASAQQRAVFLGSLAADAIRFASESAASAAKGGTPWTSAQKLTTAVEYMLRHAVVDAATAEDAIHATLPTIPGEGATRGQ